MTAETKQDLDQLKEEIGRLKDDLKEMTALLGKICKDQAAAAQDRVEQKSEQVLDSFSLAELKEQLAALKDEGEEAVDTVRKQVEKYPAGSLLAAIGLGVIIGKLLSPGNRR
ncbi:DUF883 family protein [Desulfogranum mediterraneum]|uniref:DUF883 family protein n=1 Tax=Desulfogranum mediterraneum TaxID=160661 RepID=UPI000428F415|nr:hypothetical protein [Desulfogranum mediterraneum]